MNYTMKVNLKPSDLLMVYNINTEDGFETYDGVKINTYSEITSCGDDGSIEPISRYTDLLSPVSAVYAPNKDIHDVGIVLPHAGLYTIQFYDGAEYIDSAVKNFRTNNGTNYPINASDLLSSNLDYNAFASESTQMIRDNITSLVDSKIIEKDSFIDQMVVDVMHRLRDANKYRLDNNSYVDYFFEDKSLSMLYSLLEMEHYEEVLSNSDAIRQLEEIAVSDYEEPETLSDQYQIAREGTIDNTRTQSSFITSITDKYNRFIKEFDDKRLARIIKHTNEVYADYDEVNDKVSSYINKAGNRYSASTEVGNYDASFKSVCGDYATALDNVSLHYDDTKSLVGGQYFQADLDTIRDGIKDLITNHLDDTTLYYKYYTNSRSGTSSFDIEHSKVTGSYSCSYETTCYNRFLNPYDCHCKTTVSVSNEGEISESKSCSTCYSGGVMNLVRNNQQAAVTPMELVQRVLVQQIVVDM